MKKGDEKVSATYVMITLVWIKKKKKSKQTVYYSQNKTFFILFHDFASVFNGIYI